MADVELSVTVWERTWRTVLTAEFFDRITTSVGRTFERRCVVVNNVEDPAAVRARCDELIAAGVIDGHVWVADELPAALARTGLTARQLEPLPHYTDHFLVKVCAAAPRYMVHWDTDVVLTRPGDWVTPGVDYLAGHPEVAFVTVGWPDDWSMDAERLATDGPFDLGYGFSDQMFLIDRTRFAGPIYRRHAVASWQFPTSHLTPIFEQRVDAWMRRERLQRATFREVRYEHAETMAPQPASGLARVRRKAMRAAYEAAARVPGFRPTLHYRPRGQVHGS